MKNTFYIMLTGLLLIPFAASALTFEMPTDRDLTLAEKKLGSVYRGCIGFHCLEKDAEMAVALEVSPEPCEPSEGMRPGVLSGDGYACLTVETNAREGLVVLMRSSVPARTCLDAVDGGMRSMERLADGCGDIDSEAPVMRTDDDAERAFGRLRFSGIADGSGMNLLSLIAY